MTLLRGAYYLRPDRNRIAAQRHLQQFMVDYWAQFYAGFRDEPPKRSVCGRPGCRAPVWLGAELCVRHRRDMAGQAGTGSGTGQHLYGGFHVKR